MVAETQYGQGHSLVQAQALAPGRFPMLSEREYTVQQRMRCGEACCELENEYDVYPTGGSKAVLHVKERSDCLERCCCNPAHSFAMEMIDAQTNLTVATLKRPFTCVGCHACACGLKRAVLLGPGNELIGDIGEEPCSKVGCCGYALNMKNAAGEVTEVRARKSRCEMVSCHLCKEIPFDAVALATNQGVGYVAKSKPSSFKAVMAEAAFRTSQFTMRVDAGHMGGDDRALLLTSIFMIDFGLFEQNNNNN
eukprot:TRINITY_DN3524_c0_g1_i1.p2 TRINITY_DN3524_c0_g1~~TRINITY_DN3524_c0_g1_i1.p2  ORF type:complete len:251 (+),score=92.60 TRINITY_DN3524_c0_g1_i1:65-817(+)